MRYEVRLRGTEGHNRRHKVLSNWKRTIWNKGHSTPKGAFKPSLNTYVNPVLRALLRKLRRDRVRFTVRIEWRYTWKRYAVHDDYIKCPYHARERWAVIEGRK